MVNIGIIGLGFMAATHIRAYQEMKDARIAAICNPSGRNLDGDLTNVSGNIDTGTPLKLDMKEVKPYREVDEMLADPEIDLIDICTPTKTHREFSLKALEAGKHVLCEKPLARNVEDARAIAEAVGKAKGYFMPAMF